MKKKSNKRGSVWILIILVILLILGILAYFYYSVNNRSNDNNINANNPPLDRGNAINKDIPSGANNPSEDNNIPSPPALLN